MVGPPFATAVADGLLVRLRVTPGARHESVAGETVDVGQGEALKVAVTAIAEDGKANAALGAFLAKRWRLPKSSLTLRQGATARNKIMHVAGDPASLERHIGSWWKEHAGQPAD